MKRKSIIIPASARKQMERISTYPPNVTREDCLAFLRTLPPDNQVEGEELWARLDELALLQAWAVVEKCRKEDATKSKKRGTEIDESVRQTCYLSTEQAAKYLGMSPKAVRDGAARGVVPAHKYPPRSRRGRWRFKISELDRWLASSRGRKRKLSREEVSIW